MRRAIIVCAIAIPLIAVFVTRDQLQLRLRRLYWGHLCLRHNTPPGTVLIERDPARVAALLVSNQDYVAYTEQSKPHRTFAVYQPRAWREFARVEPRSVQFRPPVWDWTPINFVAGRTSPNGKRWIVVIAGAGADALRLPREISGVVLPAPTPLERLPGPVSSFAWARSGCYVPAILSPGVSDPEDPSHISIGFFVDQSRVEGGYDRRGTMDIYVQDDGTLKWVLRDPSTTDGF